MSILATMTGGAWLWLRDTVTVGGVAGATYAAIQAARSKLQERPVIEWQLLHTGDVAGKIDSLGVNVQVYNRSQSPLWLDGLSIECPSELRFVRATGEPTVDFPSNQFLEPYAPSAPEFPRKHVSAYVTTPFPRRFKLRLRLRSGSAWIWATKTTRTFTHP